MLPALDHSVALIIGSVIRNTLCQITSRSDKLLGSTCVLLIKFLGGFSGGQEAIPYTNTEVSTYNCSNLLLQKC